MKKSKQSSNEILAGSNIRRLFTTPTIICLILFAVLLFSSVFMGSASVLTYSYDGSSGYDLISMLRTEAKYISDADYVPHYYFTSGYGTEAIELFFGIILSALQFGFLLNKKRCYTQLSFAVGRRQLFTDKVFIPVLIALSITLFVKLGALALNIHYLGLTTNLIFGFLVNIISTFQPFLYGYALGVIAHMFASRHAEAYLLLFALHELPAAIYTMADSIFSYTLYGYESYGIYTFSAIDFSVFSSSSVVFINSSYFPVYGKVDFISELLINVLPIIISTVAIILCKYYFINKFKAEQCGTRGKSHVALILSCVVLPISFVHSYSTLEWTSREFDFAPVFIIGLIITVIAAIILCLLVTWSPKKIKIGLIAAGIGVGIQVVVMLVGYSGAFGYDVKLPEANDIKSVEISVPFEEMCADSGNNDFFGYNNYMAESITLVYPEEIDFALNVHKAAIENRDDETSVDCSIIYTMKDGSTTTRSYNNLSKKAFEETLQLWKTQEINDRYAVLLNQIGVKELVKLREESGHISTYESEPSTYSYSSTEYYDVYEDYDYLYPSPIATFTSICLISKDYGTVDLSNLTDVDSFSEDYRAFSKELQTAIYKDYCALSVDEWFRPEKQLGAIAFEDNGDNYGEKNTLNRYGYVFYLNTNMTNTLKVLEKHNCMQFFENNKQIEKAHIVDIDEVCRWINQKNYSDNHLHKIYFTQNCYEITEYLSGGCAYYEYTSPDYYEDEWYDEEYIDSYTTDSFLDGFITTEKPVLPDAKEFTDMKRIKEMISDSYMAYAVGNSDDFLVVKYSDGTCSMLVLPE